MTSKHYCNECNRIGSHDPDCPDYQEIIERDDSDDEKPEEREIDSND